MHQEKPRPVSRSEIPGKRLATRDDLKRYGINVSNQTLLRWEARGRFPRRVKIGGTTCAWIVSELDDWFQERAEERSSTFYADY